MASVDDVAAAILSRTGPIDTFKLQKLVFYSEAWHLVWEAESLFDDRIEAWANGPVIPLLYKKHHGRYQVPDWPSGKAERLTKEQLESIDAVVHFYGKFKGFQLAELTHGEDPWRLARANAGLNPGERGNAEISRESMRIFYEGLIGTTDPTK
jgi:uncharacterized phage-associated protein